MGLLRAHRQHAEDGGDGDAGEGDRQSRGSGVRGANHGVARYYEPTADRDQYKMRVRMFVDSAAIALRTSWETSSSRSITR